MLLRKLLLSVIALTILSPLAHAGENLWVYTRGTDVRPQGTTEAKINYVGRYGKDSGSYTFHDLRPEIEYGFTDKFTMSGALFLFGHNYSGIEAGNDPVHETQEANGGSVDQFKVGGFQVRAKYNVLSPYKDFIGLTLGLAYERREIYRLDGADIDQNSFIPQIYLQKTFLDDTLVFAVTAAMELERRVTPGVLEEEIAFDVAAGVSYRIAPKWNIGFEFRHQSDYLCVEEDGIPEVGVECSEFDFTDFNIGDQFQNGNYVGPSIHYAEQRWFVTAGALFQIFGGGDNAFNSGGRNFDEHEEVHLGLHVGYNW